MAKVVGDELLTRYVIAFEVAGLLLTAALVGAIALAHREELEPGARRGRPRQARRCRRPPTARRAEPPAHVAARSRYLIVRSKPLRPRVRARILMTISTDRPTRSLTAETDETS